MLLFADGYMLPAPKPRQATDFDRLDRRTDGHRTVTKTPHRILCWQRHMRSTVSQS